ncbi:F-box protein CPR1-like [Papaver somniferum]|uniref:F-box protein CPR1-like n=1 Tax=Papaver somniferum TaxID=3469 RepID=UPI000E6FC0C2|nr:F-box protein CPR1-like [Papaver somniferum]
MSIAYRTRFKIKQEAKSKEEEEAITRWLNLPEEVSDEIFLKLPGNSILSSRCACKLFNTRLSKRIFIKNHVNLWIQTKNSPKLLFSQSIRDNPPMIYSIPIDFPSISSQLSSLSSVVCDGAVLMNYPFLSNKTHYHQYLGSCNGLICLKIDRVDYEREHLCTNYFSVLNPFTRQFKEFRMQTVSTFCYGIAYGFGYDSEIDDYKLVAISDNDEPTGCSSIEVYAVRSNSWSRIQCTVKYSFYVGKRSRGVFLNGGLHWLGWIGTRNKSSEAIFCFDISNEIVVVIPLPENIIPPVDFLGQVYKNLGVWGDSICVAFVYDRLRLDVWVMLKYGLKESWTKLFTTTRLPRSNRMPFWKPLLCFNNGKILVDYGLEQLVLLDTTSEALKSVVVRDITMGDNREIYVETIASLGSSTYLERRNTNGTVKNRKRRLLRHVINNPNQVPELSGSALVELALQTLACFNFKAVQSFMDAYLLMSLKHLLPVCV